MTKNNYRLGLQNSSVPVIPGPSEMKLALERANGAKIRFQHTVYCLKITSYF